jgi:membrane protein
MQERFGEVHGGGLAATITLAAFLSVFPLLLVAIAVLGFVSSSSSDLPLRLIERFGLTGEAAEAVIDALETAEDSRRTASVVGFVGLLWGGLGLVAALQNATNAVWQVTGRREPRAKLVGLVWLAGAGALFLASFALTAATQWLPGPAAPVGVLTGLLVGFALWLWTSHTLPHRDVGWKALVPGAVLGAVGFEILKAVGSLYVPRAVASSSALYGSIGVVFALLAWLFFFGRLVVYATVLDVVRWEEDHGTVTVEMEAPRVDGIVAVEATRAGEVKAGG